MIGGMFEQNMLDLNPSSDQNSQVLEKFYDVRKLQKTLKAAGFQLTSEADESSGPASIMLTDPDGNPILIDQHI